MISGIDLLNALAHQHCTLDVLLAVLYTLDRMRRAMAAHRYIISANRLESDIILTQRMMLRAAIGLDSQTRKHSSATPSDGETANGFRCPTNPALSAVLLAKEVE